MSKTHPGIICHYWVNLMIVQHFLFQYIRKDLSLISAYRDVQSCFTPSPSTISWADSCPRISFSIHFSWREQENSADHHQGNFHFWTSLCPSLMCVYITLWLHPHKLYLFGHLYPSFESNHDPKFHFPETEAISEGSANFLPNLVIAYH